MMYQHGTLIEKLCFHFLAINIPPPKHKSQNHRSRLCEQLRLSNHKTKKSYHMSLSLSQNIGIRLFTHKTKQKSPKYLYVKFVSEWLILQVYKFLKNSV